MKLRRTPLRWSGVSVLLSLIPATALAQTNMALDFDGVDDYVEVGDPVNLTGPLTLEAWVFARSATNSRRILSNRFGAGYEMDVDDSGPTIQLRLSFDGISRGSADFEPFMNTWTHVAATWGGAGEGTNLYINGVRSGGDAFAGTLSPSTATLRFGQTGFSTGFFDGRIDEIRIWSAQVDESTLRIWMTRALTPIHPNFAALEGYWRFEEGAGQSAASEVGSPALEGRLGDSASEEDSDPAWVASGATPVQPTTWGRMKSLYGN